jgi:hypothetical protein
MSHIGVPVDGAQVGHPGSGRIRWTELQGVQARSARSSRSNENELDRGRQACERRADAREAAESDPTTSTVTSIEPRADAAGAS